MKLVIYPNEILNKKAKAFKKGEKISDKLVNGMYQIMSENDGLGLAGPQVGVSKRIIILLNPFNRKFSCIINPSYQTIGDEKDYDTEGCLSLPEIHVPIERNKKIKVFGFTEDWIPISFEAEDLLARVIQHEVDHLNGITMVDKLDFMSRNSILENYQF